MITIVDYGLGNVGSIRNMCKKIGVSVRTGKTRDELEQASGIILPGVGSFDEGMRRLQSLDLRDVLDDHACRRQTPILGICLGMQLLGRSSEEGSSAGLGWIDAETRRIPRPTNSTLKVPHMGWDHIQPLNNHPLFAGIEQPRFYFVHSYHVCCDAPQIPIATCDYGICLTAAVQQENIVGVQFHPEKSHRFGLQLFRNLVAEVFDVPCSSDARSAA